MQTTTLPDTVLKALGPEAAKDFVSWLETQLGQAGLLPGLQISPFVARQKVNVLVLEQVSNLLLADEPRLIQDASENWIWRVPVDLTYPSRGRVGCAGEIDVDARYGGVRYDEPLLTEIAHKAQQLAKDTLHSTYE
jgi:hypothetical protein